MKDRRSIVIIVLALVAVVVFLLWKKRTVKAVVVVPQGTTGEDTQVPAASPQFVPILTPASGEFVGPLPT